MGAYRFAIYFKRQIGVNFSYEYGFITLDLPLIKVMFNITKNAKGTNF